MRKHRTPIKLKIRSRKSMEDDESKQLEESKYNDSSPMPSAKKVPAGPSQKLSFIKRFQLQQLNGMYISPSPNCMMCWNILCFLLLFIFGLVLLIVTTGVNEIMKDYPVECDNSKSCVLELILEKDWTPPVYLYYGIKHYYQNHRDYVKSLNYGQLKGKDIDTDKLDKSCNPVTYVKDLEDFNHVTFMNFPLSPDAPANPCGLIAKSFFNDTYKLTFKNQNLSIPLLETLISDPYDRDVIYKPNSDPTKTQYRDLKDEHFINWMQFSTTGYWVKLWGRITDTLPRGNYSLEIGNNYNCSKFLGVKSITLSQSSFLGGRNRLLGGCFMIFSLIYLGLFLCIFRRRKSLQESDEEVNYDWIKTAKKAEIS